MSLSVMLATGCHHNAAGLRVNCQRGVCRYAPGKTLASPVRTSELGITMTLSRRQLLKLALPVGVLAAARREVLLGETTALPPMRTITRGPRHHWFGYYDKLQFDPTVRFCLGNQVDFGAPLAHRRGSHRSGHGLAFHLERPEPHPRLDHSSLGRRCLLPARRPRRRRHYAHRRRCVGTRWSLSLPPGRRLDSQRHLSPRLRPAPGSLSLPHRAGTPRLLGQVSLASRYSGEWRCDTHPRFSPDQRSICIDSPHGGEGRQMHLIDIRGIVADRSAEPSTWS